MHRVRYSFTSHGPRLEFRRDILPLFDSWRVGVDSVRKLTLRMLGEERLLLSHSEFGSPLIRAMGRTWEYFVEDFGNTRGLRCGVVELDAHLTDTGTLVVELPMLIQRPWPRLNARTQGVRHDMAVEQIQAWIRLGQDEDLIPQTYRDALKPGEFERLVRRHRVA